MVLETIVLGVLVAGIVLQIASALFARRDMLESYHELSKPMAERDPSHGPSAALERWRPAVEEIETIAEAGRKSGQRGSQPKQPMTKASAHFPSTS